MKGGFAGTADDAVDGGGDGDPDRCEGWPNRSETFVGALVPFVVVDPPLDDWDTLAGSFPTIPAVPFSTTGCFALPPPLPPNAVRTGWPAGGRGFNGADARKALLASGRAVAKKAFLISIPSSNVATANADAPHHSAKCNAVSIAPWPYPSALTTTITSHLCRFAAPSTQP